MKDGGLDKAAFKKPRSHRKAQVSNILIPLTLVSFLLNSPI